jgi:hypothetical protein
LAANRRADLETLETKLKTLTDKEEIMKCTADIKKLLLYNVESLRIRAKADELTNRDLPTKFLLKCERDRAENKHMEKILDNGVELTSTTTWLKRFTTTIKIFTLRSRLQSYNIDDFFANAPCLDDVDSSMCEGHITYNECLKAIKSMKNENHQGLTGYRRSFTNFFFIYLVTFSWT